RTRRDLRTVTRQKRASSDRHVQVVPLDDALRATSLRLGLERLEGLHLALAFVNRGEGVRVVASLLVEVGLSGQIEPGNRDGGGHHALRRSLQRRQAVSDQVTE